MPIEIGTFNPTDIAQQTYADYLAREKVRQLLEQQQEMHPYDLAYKQAMTNQANAVAENYGRSKSDPLKDARAQSETLQSILPQIMAMGSEDAGTSAILRKINPDFADAFDRSTDKKGFLDRFTATLSGQNKSLAGLTGRRETNLANLSKAELDSVTKLEMQNRKLQADRELAELKQRNPNLAKINDSQLYAMLLKERVASGEITNEEARQDLSNYRALSTISKPSTGIAPTIGADGKVRIVPKTQPATPPVAAPRSAPEIVQKPTQSGDNDPLGIR